MGRQTEGWTKIGDEGASTRKSDEEDRASSERDLPPPFFPTQSQRGDRGEAGERDSAERRSEAETSRVALGVATAREPASALACKQAGTAVTQSPVQSALLAPPRTAPALLFPFPPLDYLLPRLFLFSSYPPFFSACHESIIAHHPIIRRRKN